jgi:hypothetical protein
MVFKLCGFKVQHVVSCRPQKVKRKMVDRLWFYDYPIIQYLYEVAATLYNFCRWITREIKTKGKPLGLLNIEDK